MASFTDFMNEQKKKKKKEEETESNSFSDFMEEQRNKNREESAPISKPEDIAPITSTKKEEKEEKKGLFDGLLQPFDDGWDQGDLTSVILEGLDRLVNNDFTDWLGTSAATGLASFNKGITSTADVLLGKPLQAVGWENNPISSIADYYSDQYDAWKGDQAEASEQLGGGTGWNIAGELIEGTIAAVPNMIAMLMTGGASAAPTTASLMNQAAMQAGNFLTKAGLTVETMMRNPQYWLSFARTLGIDYEEAKASGASDLTAAATSMLSSLINSGIEIGLDGGSGVQGLAQDFANGNKNGFLAWVESTLEEGGEEVIQGFINNGIAKLTYDEDRELANLGDMAKEFGMGAGVGALLGGGVKVAQGVTNTAHSIQADKAREKARQNLTENEQKVIDKLVSDKIAEAEKDGKKLSNSEKKKIRDSMITAMDEGTISTDAIEELFGGDTFNTFKTEKDGFFASDAYKSYNDTIVSERQQLKQLQDQLKALGSEPNTVENAKKYDSIQSQIEALKKSTKSAELKAQLDMEAKRINGIKQQLHGEVYELVKGDRLAQSYYELARKGLKYQADVSKYENEYARKTVQNIMDSGLGDGTRQFGKFVDFLANVSARTGMTVSLTNDELLKGTAHDMSDIGARANAFVTDSGDVTLNMDSDKALNSLVGHEITHVLEKMGESYAGFSEFMKNFAIAKEGLEGYNKRIKKAEQLYKGKKNTTAEAEVVADLVGDYLFTDSDFIRKLSVEHQNIFQKIWDEIKYLCKVATGTKEARELERVKKAFLDIYNENSKNVKKTDTEVKGDVHHSLSIKYTDGTVEELADARGLTNEQAVNYLNKAKNGSLRRETYIPVRKDTPQVIIDTMAGAGEIVGNHSLVMQVRKAQQSMSVENPGGNRSGKTGSNVRKHALSPEQIVEIVNKLDDPSLAIYQTNRHDKHGNPLPNNVAFFVEYNNNGTESVAVIEFDSSIDPEFIGTEYGDTSYHTVVTVFEPDVERDGVEFDYAEELLSNQDNIELKIERRQSTGSATGEKHPNTSSELPSFGANLAQNGNDVKPKYSISDSDGNQLSKGQQDFFKDSVVRDENGNLKVMYHGTSKGGFTVFDTFGSNYGLFGAGSYFTDSKSIAESYTTKGKGKNPQVYKTYLNITNPMDMAAPADPDAWAEAFPDASFPESGTNEDFYRAMEEYFEDNYYPRWEAAEIAMDAIMGMGYDGITHIGGGRVNADGERHQVYIAFEAEQIKNTDNLNPTDDVDIRYSMSDSDGNKLTKEQADFFHDSKIVDKEGNLLKVYHTSDADFTVFDKAKKGEKTDATNTFLGFFFAESPDHMGQFPEFQNGTTKSFYLNMKKPMDLTNLSKEAFMDIVELTGGDRAEAAEIYDQELEAEKARAKLRGDNTTSLSISQLLYSMVGDYYHADFFDALKPNYDKLVAKGYDGVIDYLDEMMGEREFIVFDSNQAKLTSNMNPTADDDVRYSFSSIANSFFGKEDMSTSEFLMDDFHETEGYKNYVEECLNNLRQSKVDFDEDVEREAIRNAVDGIVRVAVAAKQAGYDIMDSSAQRDLRDSKKRLLFSSLEPNSDYFTSHDISTICDKRKNFAEIYDEIVRIEEAKGVPKGKRFFDNVDNYFAIHKIMADKGLTTPCRQCYVESMRKNLAPMAEAFLALVQETDPNNTANAQLFAKAKNDTTEYVVGADGKRYAPKASNTAKRNFVLEAFEQHPEYPIRVEDLTIEMLTTAEGLAQLRIQAPLVYEAFNSFYGQAKPKMPKQATPFRFGELTALLTNENGKINKNLVDKINSTGGFRLQSYSDFQIQNYVDVLQVLFEAGTLGLNGHAYTKVPAFLEATEGTNLKRNISIFMYKDGDQWKLDRNDSFPYSLEEIYDIVNNDKTGSTSIIAVSQNADMSAWIMANDYVGYGIPFHKSGLKMGTVRDTNVKTDDGRVIKGYSGTIDHTKQQTEVWAKAGDGHKALTKVSKGINVYSFWDFDNKSNLSKNELIEKNVKAYIDQCEMMGYLPKFRNYVMNNGKVLNDVLKYSKRLGFVSQDATIEDISFQYKGYTIPYGYYKFLGDFGMFTPDGKAAPQQTLSMENYNFDKAVEFFSDAESLRRTEILQQFANGKVRSELANSNMTTEELEALAKQKRTEVANEALAPVRNSISEIGEQPVEHGDYHIYGKDIGVQDEFGDFAPVADGVAPVTESAPYEDNWAEAFDALTDEDAPPVRDMSRPKEIGTVAEKIKQKIINTQAELDKNRQLRDQSFKDYDDEIARLQAKYDSKKNKNTRAAQDILRSIERLKRIQANINADYSKRVSDLESRLEKLHSKEYSRAEHRRAKMEGYTEMWEDMVGDTSTWKDMALGLQYKTKTLRRILRKVVKDADGNADIAKADQIYDELETKYDHNEALLKRESQKLKDVFQNLKLNHAEDTYAQMLGELRHNPDTTLTEDAVNEYYNKHKGKIDTAKVDTAIAESRKLYDDLLVRVNEVLREQGFKEIPYREGYFPHFTNPKQNWLQKMLNWKPVDNDIPTSIAGLTETFKPSRSWQKFDKRRMGDTTDYSLYQGLDTYIHGALDWVYHIEDLQKRRSLENYLRYIHSDEGIQKRIEEIKKGDYDADEAQEMINAVLKEADNPLGGLVRELMNRTNTLANKKAAADRALEDDTNRKVYSVLTNLNNRVTSNMVVGSFSSALTNFIPMVQSWHQVSPYFTVRGLGDFVRSTVHDDGMVAKSDFLTNRLVEEEKLYQTGWDKVTDKAAFMMDAIDNITSQTVWRSKYLQNIKEGMSESKAIKDADQFAKNLMAGRSRGNAPTIFDAKNPWNKLFTAFQLEVANQYGYMFEDVPQDSTNKLRLVKGYATAFLGAYMYNALYSALVGRDAAFDPISIIQELLGDLMDDEEEDQGDALLNFGKNILEEVPFIGGLLGGGRVPISSAIPYSNDNTPIESLMSDVKKAWNDGNFFEGEWTPLVKEVLKPLYYLAMPVGGGQIKKTIEGLGMFSDDHPIAGSYTDSGALRFPVEENFGNILQAGLFGQYASSNARDYFDNDYAPLGGNQIKEFIDVGMSIQDYWKYRKGLSGLSTLAEKADYIDSLDLTDEQKNILINNIADRDEDIDMSGYGNYGSFEEFDFAQKNPDKYQFFNDVGISWNDYSSANKDKKSEYSNMYNWVDKNPGKYTMSKAVSNDFLTYWQYKSDLGNLKADKDKYGETISGSKKQKVVDYINGLPLDYGQKIIMFRSMYDGKEDRDYYNADILEYLNSRTDLTFEEIATILTELGFTVYSDGRVTWD